MKPNSAMVLAAALVAAHSAFGQPRVEPPGGPPGPRPAGAQGPWNNDVLVHRVSASGMVTSLATFERAGVPTVTRMKDGRLIAAHQHFPENDEANFDKVAVRFSSDEGRTWTAPEVMRVDGLPEGMRFPFDPTLVVLPDGRVRLYFTGMRGRMFEANQPAIYSAISTDGLSYVFEPGVRFAVEGRPVIDCAAVLHQGVFHLYSPDNGTRIGPGAAGGGGPEEGTGYHAVSRDGLNFERQGDVRIEGRRRWLGNAQSDGKAITFFGTGDGGGPARGGAKPSRGGVWMASSGDGREWKLMEAPEVPGADPGAVAARDGGWVVVSTGPPVPGRTGPRMMRGGQQQNPPGHQGGPFAGTMPMGDDGPRGHRVLLATSKDGLRWEIGAEVLAEPASVPEMFPGTDGQPIVMFVDPSGRSRPGMLGAMVRQADGAWVRRDTNLRGADPNVVRLRDGTYRGYTKEPDGTIVVFSSRDGWQWEREGVAFADEAYRSATDSDVFETPDGWVMLISLGPRLLRATSPDGLRFAADKVLDLGGSVSDTVEVEGGWRTFFHVNGNPQTGERMRIRSAFTRDGRTWSVEPGDRVAAPGSGPARLGVADPAPLRLPDGSWLMAVKSFIARGEGRPQPPGGGGAFRRPPGQGPREPGGGDGGIRAHNVLSASSKDGLVWTRDAGVRIPSASVPCAINDGDKRVLVYFVQPPNQPGRPETVACAVSTDGMTFEQAPDFRIEGLSTLKAVDPSIVRDADGTFRLYYLASNHRGDPASGENPHAIHLAVSEDGIRFRETGPVFAYDDLVDPDIFQHKGRWFMYVFAKRATVIAASADGGKFTYEREMSPSGWGTVAPLALGEGRLRLYAFDQRSAAGNAVRSFLSTDGLNWTAESGDRLKAGPAEQITDPFVIPWRGGFKMYFKLSPARMPLGAAP